MADQSIAARRRGHNSTSGDRRRWCRWRLNRHGHRNILHNKEVRRHDLQALVSQAKLLVPAPKCRNLCPEGDDLSHVLVIRAANGPESPLLCFFEVSSRHDDITVHWQLETRLGPPRAKRTPSSVLRLPKQTQKIEWRRQRRLIIVLENGLNPREGPGGLRHGLVLLIGAVHHSNEQIHQQHVANESQYVDQDRGCHPRDGRKSLQLGQCSLVHAPHNGPERPGEALVVPLLDLREENWSDGAAERTAENEHQDEELQRVLGHSEDGDQKGSEMLRVLQHLQHPDPTGQQIHRMHHLQHLLRLVHVPALVGQEESKHQR
mmetsp:Transcript_21012/g.49284  ORF Transcript_21012/g.49284 Transcript_21012/m.49284 type:complete len:319 (-) Transcript_21012:2400-3356(-)